MPDVSVHYQNVPHSLSRSETILVPCAVHRPVDDDENEAQRLPLYNLALTATPPACMPSRTRKRHRCAGGVARRSCRFFLPRMASTLRKIANLSRRVSLAADKTTDASLAAFLRQIANIMRAVRHQPPQVRHVCQIDRTTQGVYDWPVGHGSTPLPSALRGVCAFVQAGAVSDRAIYFTSCRTHGSCDDVLDDACILLHEVVHIRRGRVSAEVNDWLSTGVYASMRVLAQEEVLALAVEDAVGRCVRCARPLTTLTALLEDSKRRCVRDYSYVEADAVANITCVQMTRMIATIA